MPVALSDTAKLEEAISILTLVIKIGRYLPWIVLAFALVNFTLALLDFTFWNNIAGGVLNAILAFGGFLFFSQLFGRRKVHRYDYRYTGRHLRKPPQPQIEPQLRQRNEAAAS